MTASNSSDESSSDDSTRPLDDLNDEDSPLSSPSSPSSPALPQSSSSSNHSSTLRITCVEPNSLRVTCRDRTNGRPSTAVRVTRRDRQNGSSNNRENGVSSSTSRQSNSTVTVSTPQSTSVTTTNSSSNPCIVVVVPPSSVSGQNSRTEDNTSTQIRESHNNNRRFLCTFRDVIHSIVRFTYLTCCEFLPWVIGSVLVYYAYILSGLTTAVSVFLLMMGAHGVLRWVKTNGISRSGRCFEKPRTPQPVRRVNEPVSYSLLIFLLVKCHGPKLVYCFSKF